jgi:hypothetical protein
MVSVAGGPGTVTRFLGKTDFWRGRGKGGAVTYDSVQQIWDV